jgi:aromatic-amino-acid transaminase
MAAATLKTVQQGLFATLKQQPPDQLLSLIKQFEADSRPHKIDLGVGMYRNEEGVTQILHAVKAAERTLLDRQTTKGYLGPEGDIAFVDLLKPIVFGKDLAQSGRIVGVQTPGGTGALRLAADLIHAASPDTRVWLGLPAWPNYRALFTAARLPIETYAHFDTTTQRLTIDEIMAALNRARRGDVIVLQACCHNPTGSDFTDDQWAAIAATLHARGLIPLLDIAYQGLGRGLDEDAAGLRRVLNHVGEALIAYSCNKNFALYRERTGALFAYAAEGQGPIVYSNMMSVARGNWSMPPDHGAAVVRTILESTELTSDWRRELTHMRTRIAENRKHLAEADPRLTQLAHQAGMFSTLNIAPEAVERLKTEHAIYMAISGRINVAGFKNKDDIATFVSALNAVTSPRPPSGGRGAGGEGGRSTSPEA